jgi:pimeloyl-ACP methyl ester carboxylesterase
MYVDPCLELLTALSEQTGIGRWVLGGLCGGAVTAVLAADHSPERIAGLLLIDLDVSLLPVGEGETISGASSLSEANGDRFPASLSSSLPASSTKGPVLQRLFSRRTWVRFATGEGRLGGRFPGLRRAVGRWIENENERGAELPSDRNQAVVDSLCGLLDHGMSVLSIRARGKMRDIYAESVDHVNFKHAWPPHYQVLRLEGTNHVFTAGEGETHVLEAVSHWLATHVPHCASSDRAVGSPTLEQ